MVEDKISLKEYVDLKIGAIDKATSVAYASMEKRLEGMNEFRNQLKDQNITFITKAEYSAHMNKIEEDIRILRESKAQLEGKASQSDVNSLRLISYISLAIGLSGLLITLIKLLGVV
jgi:hypothetical protein